jgi:enoyl-CoA hydratase/carnithine racemase
MVPLTRTIGRKKALEMLLIGSSLQAEEAKQHGLINKVVERSTLDMETKKMAKKIIQYNQETIEIGKKAFYYQIDHLERDAYHYAKEVISLNCLSYDAQEGIKAMLEKRKPQWKNDD